MRLGKEQAMGYVEDTEADSLPVTEGTAAEVMQATVGQGSAFASAPSLTAH